MPEPIATGSAIAAGWKILSSLYGKYEAWSVRKSKSKSAQALKLRAEQLMKQINSRILSGASSDDPELAPVIKEFRQLLDKGPKPDGYETTERWIDRSKRYSTSGAKVAAKKPAAKKAMAKKPAAKKAMAKKPAAKKV